MANRVGRYIEQVGFACLETSKGQIAYPQTPEEFIIGAGAIEINQQPTYTNSEEIINSLDVIDRFQDQVGAGTFTVPMYLRPSGTPGDLPAGPVLYQSLMGKVAVNAGTDVEFSQSIEKPSFTLWVKKSHTVFFGVGACADTGALNITNKGGSLITFSGGFMRMGWAGEDMLAADAVVGSDTIEVEDASKFTADALIQIGSNDNNGDGHKIASVDYVNNTLTLVDPMPETITIDVVKGYLPESLQTIVGSPLENRKTVLDLDGSPFKIKSLDLSIGSPVVYQVDEITEAGYPEDYVEDTRNITGTISMLFRSDDLGLFRKGYNNVTNQVVVTIGDTPGSQFEITLPKSQLDVPAVASSKPTLDLSMGLTALGTSGEDSAILRFF